MTNLEILAAEIFEIKQQNIQLKSRLDNLEFKIKDKENLSEYYYCDNDWTSK